MGSSIRRGIAVVAIVGLAGSLLVMAAPLSPAGAAALPGSALPVLAPIDTMATCPGGGTGVWIPDIPAGVTCSAVPAGAVVIKRLDRYTGQAIGADTTVGSDCLDPCNTLSRALDGLTNQTMVVLSAPSGLRLSSGSAATTFLHDLGIVVSSITSGAGGQLVEGFAPFSAILVAGCGRACAISANSGRVLRNGAAGARQCTFGQAVPDCGRLKGYLQPSTGNALTYVAGDYVAFDTAAENPVTGRPSLLVDDLYLDYPVDDGTPGFGLVLLDPWTLQPQKETPRFFGLPSSGAGAADQREAALASLHQVLQSTFASTTDPKNPKTAGSYVYVLQTIGQPVPGTASWNDVLRDVSVVQGDRVCTDLQNPSGCAVDLPNADAELATLNRPDAPGLHIPTGYTLLARTVPAAAGAAAQPMVQRATTPSVGTKVRLYGAFARQRDSGFAPLLADGAGLTDPSLMSIAYQPLAPAWPHSGGDDAAALAAIRSQLLAKGFGGGIGPFDDLRSYYVASITDPRWTGTWPALIDQVTNTGTGAPFASFDAVRDEVRAELQQVQQVRAALVDVNTSVILRILDTVSTEGLTALTNAVLNTLPKVQPHPAGLDIGNIIINVMFAASTALGGAGGLAAGAIEHSATAVLKAGQELTTLAKEQINQARRVAELALGPASTALGITASGLSLAGVFASGGGEVGTAPYAQPTQDAAVNVAKRIGEGIGAGRVGITQLATVLVSDPHKLAAAADLLSKPPYASANIGQTVAAARNQMLAAAQGELMTAILPVGWNVMDAAQAGKVYEQQPLTWHTQCNDTDVAEGSVLAATHGYNTSAGDPRGVPQAEPLRLSPTVLDCRDANPRPDLNQQLLDLLFSPPTESVTVAGAEYPGIGFDPQQFFRQFVKGYKETTVLDLAPAWSPGVAIEALEGGASAAATNGIHAQIRLRVTDSGGNPVPGQTVTVTFPSAPGATIDQQTTAAALTGPDGVATFTRPKADTTPGAYQANASVTLSRDQAAAYPSLALAGLSTGATATVQLRMLNWVSTSTQVVVGEATTRFDAPVQLDAHVTSADPTRPPTGTVTFTIGRNVDGEVLSYDVASATVGSDGWAHSGPVSVAEAGPGSFTVSAYYQGDDVHHPSADTASTALRLVQGMASTTSLEVAPEPADAGTPLTIVATVRAPAQPPTPNRAGTVAIRDLSGALPGCAAVPISWSGLTGTATCTAAALPPATEVALTASFSGDSGLNPSTSPAVTHVTRAASVLTVTPDVAAPVVGQPVTFGIAITAPGTAALATGTVTVRDSDLGRVVDGCEALVLSASGTTSCSEAFTPAGAHHLTIAYSGDALFQPRSSATTITVGKAGTDTVLSSQPDPSVTGEAIVYRAMVTVRQPGSGTPTGTVTFTEGGTPLPGCTGRPLAGTPLVATCSYTAATAESHLVVASYEGDASFSASTSAPALQVVHRAPTSVQMASTPRSPVTGAPFELSATVAPLPPGQGRPNGVIDFIRDNTTVATVLVDRTGQASAPVAGLSPGTYTFTASYRGDADFLASMASIDVVVGRATPSLTIGVDPAAPVAFEPVTIRVQAAAVAPASGTPTGSVTLTINGAPAGTIALDAGGVATLEGSSGLHAGLNTISASYGGDDGFSSASGTRALTVAKASTELAMASDPSAPTALERVTLTATVRAVAPSNGRPTGTVTFVEGTASLGTAPIDFETGTAKLALADGLHGGAHEITVRYGGDSQHDPSTVSQTVVVKAIATTLDVDPASSLGTSLRARLTRTDTGAPIAGGPVTFMVGGAVVCADVRTDAAGTAKCKASGLKVVQILLGGYSASYPGNADYAPATGKST